MFLLISACIVLIYSFYMMTNIYRVRGKLEKMLGMMVVMVFVSVSSVTIGLLLGIYFTNDLTISTIAAIIYGIVIGYYTGKFVSAFARLEGIGAGFMGGMMGAMLGDMIPLDDKWMILFMTVLFIALVIYLSYVLHSELKEERTGILFRPYRLLFTSILSGLIIITFASFEGEKPDHVEINTHQHHG